VALFGFATMNSLFLLLSILVPSFIVIMTGSTVLGGLTMSANPAARALAPLLFGIQFFSIHSLVLAPTSWLLVGGLWKWRGQVRSRWEGLGFDSDVFRLFMRMKGGKTRLRLLIALSKPKDRHQLAKELGMDWRAVDQHISSLTRHGLVHNEVVYGKVRMYQLTTGGKSLLQLLESIDSEARERQSIGNSSIEQLKKESVELALPASATD
jgi:DNA-binding transcriptional ArsR family regulator